MTLRLHAVLRRTLFPLVPLCAALAVGASRRAHPAQRPDRPTGPPPR